MVRAKSTKAIEAIEEIVDTLEPPDIVDIGVKPKPKAKRKSTTQTKAKASSAPTSQKRTAKRDLKSRLEESFGMLGLLLYAFDPYDGQVILTNAPRLAESLTNLAKANPTVRKILEAALAAGAWSEVLSVVIGGVLGPILIHHELLPDAMNRNLSTILEIPIRSQEPTSPESNDATS